jgi:serine/threonine protein kinase
MRGVPLPPFQIAGKYEVEAILGRGGMGVVYLARQKPLGRKVAIKMVLDWHADDQSFMKRFRREAELVSGLSHQGIVNIYDVVEHEGAWCLVLEYVRGRTLKQEIQRRGRLSATQALQVGVETAEALDFCHRRRIVHRDIKPDNIMINDEGRVKVMDFGVAKDPDATTRTQAGIAIGTPKYMSPEQAQGLPSIDGRSDVYSLGCVLFEMVTGRVPFDGDQSLAIAMAHVREPPPRPREYLASIHPGVEAAILQCLRKKPEDRFQSAAELAKRLEALRHEIALTQPDIAAEDDGFNAANDGTNVMDSHVHIEPDANGSEADGEPHGELSESGRWVAAAASMRALSESERKKVVQDPTNVGGAQISLPPAPPPKPAAPKLASTEIERAPMEDAPRQGPLWTEARDFDSGKDAPKKTASRDKTPNNHPAAENGGAFWTFEPASAGMPSSGSAPSLASDEVFEREPFPDPERRQGRGSDSGGSWPGTFPRDRSSMMDGNPASTFVGQSMAMLYTLLFAFIIIAFVALYVVYNVVLNKHRPHFIPVLHGIPAPALSPTPQSIPAPELTPALAPAPSPARTPASSPAPAETPTPSPAPAPTTALTATLAPTPALAPVPTTAAPALTPTPSPTSAATPTPAPAPSPWPPVLGTTPPQNGAEASNSPRLQPETELIADFNHRMTLAGQKAGGFVPTDEALLLVEKLQKHVDEHPGETPLGAFHLAGFYHYLGAMSQKDNPAQAEAYWRQALRYVTFAELHPEAFNEIERGQLENTALQLQAALKKLEEQASAPEPVEEP